MSVHCLIADVDGFSGRPAREAPAVLIPREIGVVWLQLGRGARVHLAQSLYFRGGLSREFRAKNGEAISYQTRSVSGYPQGDDEFVRTLPRGALLFALPDDPVAAEAESEAVAAQRLGAITVGIGGADPVVLVHKGGTEGRWLAALAARLGRPASVVDLNDFSCPKVDDALADPALRAAVEAHCRCDVGVHGRLSRHGQRWARHCPQGECLFFAAWIAALCRPAEPCGRVAGLTRAPTLDAGGLDAFVAAACRQGSCPPAKDWVAPPNSAAWHRCANFVGAALMRAKEYVPPADIAAVIARFQATLTGRTDTSPPPDPERPETPSWTDSPGSRPLS